MRRAAHRQHLGGVHSAYLRRERNTNSAKTVRPHETQLVRMTPRHLRDTPSCARRRKTACPSGKQPPCMAARGRTAFARHGAAQRGLKMRSIASAQGGAQVSMQGRKHKRLEHRSTAHLWSRFEVFVGRTRQTGQIWSEHRPNLARPSSIFAKDRPVDRNCGHVSPISTNPVRGGRIEHALGHFPPGVTALSPLEAAASGMLTGQSLRQCPG